MSGTITSKHLFLNGLTIIRYFGMNAYLRCLYRTLLTRETVTFLDCVIGADSAK